MESRNRTHRPNDDREREKDRDAYLISWNRLAARLGLLKRVQKCGSCRSKSMRSTLLSREPCLSVRQLRRLGHHHFEAFTVRPQDS